MISYDRVDFDHKQGTAQPNCFRKGPFNPFLRLAIKASTQRGIWSKDTIMDY